MSYTYQFPRPAVTADTVVVAPLDGTLRVLLIRRRSPPFAGRWALPGGFLDMDETLAAAARRELREETGLAVTKLTPLGTYDAVDRDPRGRTISGIFLAVYPRAVPKAAAGDDAAAVGWFALRRPPRTAFDHDRVLRDARRALVKMAADPAQFARALLPRRMPFDRLFDVFSGLDRSLDRRAFRRVVVRLGLVKT